MQEPLDIQNGEFTVKETAATLNIKLCVWGPPCSLHHYHGPGRV